MSQSLPPDEKSGSKSGEAQPVITNDAEHGAHGPLEEIEVDLGEALKTDGVESYESEHSPFAEGTDPCPGHDQILSRDSSQFVLSCQS